MIGYENPEILVVPLRILNHLVLNSALSFTQHKKKD